MVLVLSAVPAAWAQSGATIATLNVSSNNASTGTAVTLTASVVSGTTPVTAGQVLFCKAGALHCEDSAIIGSAWMTKSGTATIHKVFSLGTHNIQAVFKGTNSYAASTSAATVINVTGSPVATTATISATGTTGNYTLTGTVATGSAVVPTGSVSFLDASNGNSLLASAALGAPLLTSSYANSAGPAATSFNQTIATGDFNNDGKLDYVVASMNSSATATIMLGNGDGTFTAGATYSAGDYPDGAVVADLNGDGNLDIAFSNSAANGVTILLGNGDGTFSSAASPAVGYAASIAAGDFNGDGIPDLAVSNNGYDYAVTILLGNGDGTFTAGASVSVPQWSVIPQGILAMDFNGDGKADLAVTSSDGYTPASYVVTILLGNGDGTFTTGRTYTTGAADLSIAGGDFNGDGIPDLAIANYAGSTVTILLGNGDGTFNPGAPAVTGAGPNAIVAGDFNNDGKLDLATANYGDSTVTILLGNGDGTFTASSSLPATGPGPDGIVAGDFTGNGLLDFVTANYDATTASILLQAVTSTATATASGVSITGNGETHNVLAIYSGDSNYSSSLSSTIALGTTSLSAQTISFPNPGSRSYGTTLTLSATASSGLPVSFAVTSGPATLSGSSTLTLTGTGLVTVRATQGGNSIYSAATAVSVSFTVTPAPLTVTALNQWGVFGALTPPLTGTLVGVIAGDGITANYSTTANQGSPVGSYPITPVLNDPNGKLANYSVTSIPAMLMIVAGVTPTQSSLNFGTVVVGATTGNTLSLSFIVPYGLTLGSVTSVTEGAPNLDFTITGGTCVNGTTDAICTVQVQFLPLAPGERQGALLFTDQSTPANTLLTDWVYGAGTAPLVSFAPGTISTIASAPLNWPDGVAVDGGGNVYVADWNNNAIRKVTPGGIMTTVAGGNGGGYSGDGGLATSAQIDGPATVKLDGAGNMYIADYYNNAIRKVTPGGIITTVAGGKGAGYSGDGGPATIAQINGPWGTASDGAGNLYIGDSTNNVVRKVAADGTITTYAGTGSAGYSGDGSAAISAQFNTPQVGAADAAGNLYLVDFYNDVVRKITPGGVVTTVAGNNALGLGHSGDGGPATSAQLYYPQMVAVDAAGDLYIADTGNFPSIGSGYGVIRKVTPNGIITTVAGSASNGYSGDGGLATSAQLYGPWDLAVDAAGNIYIADMNNNAVRKVNVSAVPALIFANDSSQPGAAQDVSVLNIGSAPLTVSSISISGNVSLGGADTSCSSGNQTLAPGSSCVLGIELTTTGSVSGSVVLTDNTLGSSGSTQTITAQGSSAPASQSIILVDPGMLTYGAAPVPVAAATVKSPLATSGQLTQRSQRPRAEIAPHAAPTTLSATATSGLPVDIAVTSGPATLSGNELVITGAGTVTVQATQAGNTVYAAAAPVRMTLTVNPAPLTVVANKQSVPFGSPIPALTGTLTGVVAGDGITASYTTTATSSPQPGSYPITPVLDDPNHRLGNYTVTATSGTLTIGQNATATTLQTSAAAVMSLSDVTFTAKVSGLTSTTAGSVNFMDGNTVMGTAALDNTGTAALTINTLAAGSHSITAVYAGNVDFAGSTSIAITEAVQDFNFTATSVSSTVNPGGTAVYTLQLSPTNGSTLAGAVTLALTGLPTGATCTISPSTIAAGSGATTVTVKVNTASQQASSGLPSPKDRGGLPKTMLLALSLPFFGMQKLRRALLMRVKTSTLMLLTLVVMMAAGMTACGGGGGGGSSSSGGGSGGSSQPAAQTYYSMTLTGTSGALQHPISLTLTVQ
jgi:hypothetical protein